MKIPRRFSEALNRAYHSKAELDKLFIEQYPFLMRLVSYALRYKHWAVLSDRDDLYQEACIWLVNSMWEWDETRGVKLDEYVVYNIGARLRNIIVAETRPKRRPLQKPSRIEIDYHTRRTPSRSYEICYASQLEGNVATPEELLIAKSVCMEVNKKLPMLAKDLLENLILTDGNFSKACRQVLDSGRVRTGKFITKDAFRQALRRGMLPKIKTVFSEMKIIPENGKL